MTAATEAYLSPMEDTDEEKVCAMNLLAFCVNQQWSFAGLYFDARDDCYKASFRRFIRDSRAAPGAKPRRRSMSETASGTGQTPCGAIVAAAQNALDDAEDE